MRVLSIVESLSPEWGGLSRVTANLSEAMVRSGIEVEIITTSMKQDEEIFRPRGVKVQALLRRKANSWGYAPHLLQVIKSAITRADLVHLHGLWLYPHLVASRSAWSANKPYIVSPHGMLDQWALVQSRFKKRVYGRIIEWRTIRRAAAVHAVSEGEAERVKCLGLSSKVITIPNGVNNEEFTNLPNPSLFRLRHPMLAGNTVLLFLSRVHPKKGLEILIKAFCEISKERSDIVLVIAGPGEINYVERLKALLDAEGVAGRYIFTGMLEGEERLAVLAAADVFILPSYSEGLPLAVLEALAAKLPVILTDACNIPEIEESNAGLVTDHKITSLRQAILRLVNDGPLRKRMGLNGQQLVLANYTWDKIASRMLEAYRAYA